MRDCPKCGAPVDGQWCKQCGEGKPAAGVDSDMYDWQCVDRDRFGMRCAAQGTRSPTTMNRGPSGKGQNGPWYCAAHDPQTHNVVAFRTAPPQGFQALRNALRLPADDPEAIAERQAIQNEAA